MYRDILTTLADGSPHSQLDDLALLEPFRYISSTPGKGIRGTMIEGFNCWLNVPQERLQIINRVIAMLHSASLLVDDIEDDSQLRRGKPVAHKIFGVPQTINAANYAYFLAFEELFALRDAQSVTDDNEKTVIPFDQLKELDRIVTSELLALHRGQGLDIMWRDSLRCPTEEQYVNMVNNKTGGLFRLAVKLMMACATTHSNTDFVPLVNLIGVYFQIRDDYMNLQSTQYAENKGFAEDLTEGKFSFPIVHGINENASDRSLIGILQKRPTTPTMKFQAIKYLESTTKSFKYTLDVMHDLESQAYAEIAKLGGNPILESILNTLHVEF